MGLPRMQILTLALLILICGAALGADQKYVQARVKFDSVDQMMQLRGMHLDIMHVAPSFYEIVSVPEEIERLKDMGFEVEIIHDDMVAFYQSRFPDLKQTGYLTLSQVNAELNFDHILYPDITTERISIGQTLEGRDIYAIKISDNPNDDEDEPEVFYNACIHAREVITPLVLLHFIEYLLENYGVDPYVTNLVNERELWFVPIVNPDGYQYNVSYNWPGGMWRKNRRNNGDGTFGVDLNRNFDYQWAYDDEGSSPYGGDETYRGTAPFSEPATQVIRDFCIDHDFVMCVNYHSCSNLYLWAYSYNNSHTPDEDIFSALGDSMNVFNGYFPNIDAVGYPVNGGADDWMYGEQTTKNKIFAMTTEVGNYYDDGFWPETQRIPELVEENLLPNLLIAEVAGHVEQVLPPEAPILTVPDSVDAKGSFEINWSCDDPRNPPVQYEVVEMTDYNILTDPCDNFNNWDERLYELSSGSFYSGGDNFDWRYIQTILPYYVLPNDSLKFSTNYALSEPLDYAYIQISADGENFVNLEGNITTNEDPYGINLGNGITGYSGGWIDARFDLSDYVGQSVYFRFSYKIFQMAWYWDGIHFDNIYPVPGFENFNVVSSTITDTSYTFTDKPEGLYFYKVRSQDADGQWGDYSEIKAVVVGNPTICMDPDGDGYGVPGFPYSNCPDDNCPYAYNPGQEDIDGDGTGDVCDACTDSDGDGYGDPGFAANTCDVDNCPDDYNPDQADPDGDNIGSVSDNCPDVYNPEQTDTDGDNLGDACDFLCGDPNGDWTINIFDVTYLIGFLYLEGPPPVDMNSCDVNGDTNVNIFDIVYIINYLYLEGPDPACP